MENGLNKLPPGIKIDSIEIYKALNAASRALAELKGESKTIPNETILINTLGLQEAKDSSAIENIITTYDDIYHSQVDDTYNNIAAKEVIRYSEALKHGYELVKTNKLLTCNFILEIQKVLEPNKTGLRKLPGTVLQNSLGETIYTPPQNPDDIILLMSNLEKYINDDELHPIDPLMKMAIIHYQFESIHPFYDGNGRTGRIINILYLFTKGLLDIPILYLSRYIIANKSDYYRLLQDTREKNNWEEWIIWILNGVRETAEETLDIVKKIQVLMSSYQIEIKEKLPKVYSKSLVEHLFKHPYTKIESLENDLGIHRQTASIYLNKLCQIGILKKMKLWKNNYYLNEELYNLLKDKNA
jgi:Fic family protein